MSHTANEPENHKREEEKKATARLHFPLCEQAGLKFQCHSAGGVNDLRCWVLAEDVEEYIFRLTDTLVAVGEVIEKSFGPDISEDAEGVTVEMHDVTKSP